LALGIVRVSHRPGLASRTHSRKVLATQAALLIAICSFSGAGGATPALAAANSTSWAHPAHPASLPAALGLFSISCPGAETCWAVGRSRHGTVALRWNGRAWATIPIPTPRAQNEYDNGASVACAAPTSCWAVGGTDNDSVGSAASSDTVAHWNGERWRLVPVPSPKQNWLGTRYADDALQSVSCASPSECWAVGYQGSRRLALLWNGRRWRRIATPPAYSPIVRSDLMGVTCAGPNACWAVGTAPLCWGSPRRCSQESVDGVLRWGGARWKEASAGKASKNQLLSAVSCVSSHDCWAIGANGGKNQAIHWNGKRWLSVQIPTPGSNWSVAFGLPGLFGIACASPDLCWAVGTDLGPGGTGGNEILKWDGHRWSVATVPQPAGDSRGELRSVACNARRSCWAVGQFLPSGVGEVLRWSGRRWRRAKV